MIIAVVLETVSSPRNKDILDVLNDRGHTIINAGMKGKKDEPQLSYIHSGLLAALLLNTERADMIIGGCGTGQGFAISTMQYPNVFCGQIKSPLDAWLFAQINAGNCISLALTQNYGWASEIDLKLMFDTYFSVEKITGYPQNRKEPQRLSRNLLASLSKKINLPFDEVLLNIDKNILKPVLEFPGMIELLDIDNIKNEKIRNTLKKILKNK